MFKQLAYGLGYEYLRVLANASDRLQARDPRMGGACKRAPDPRARRPTTRRAAFDNFYAGSYRRGVRRRGPRTPLPSVPRHRFRGLPPGLATTEFRRPPLFYSLFGAISRTNSTACPKSASRATATLVNERRRLSAAVAAAISCDRCGSRRRACCETPRPPSSTPRPTDRQGVFAPFTQLYRSTFSDCRGLCRRSRPRFVWTSHGPSTFAECG